MGKTELCAEWRIWRIIVVMLVVLIINVIMNVIVVSADCVVFHYVVVGL